MNIFLNVSYIDVRQSKPVAFAATTDKGESFYAEINECDSEMNTSFNKHDLKFYNVKTENILTTNGTTKALLVKNNFDTVKVLFTNWLLMVAGEDADNVNLWTYGLNLNYTLKQELFKNNITLFKNTLVFDIATLMLVKGYDRNDNLAKVLGEDYTMENNALDFSKALLDAYNKLNQVVI